MQLFLFLNDLAGRWPILDEIARFFYVGAVPALGTLVLAQLLLLPRPTGDISRSKTALTLVLALALGALLTWGFDLVAAQLHLGILSPRPWMTRRVNWLVVEPQDNSFPCVEVVFAAALTCASWKLNRRIGIGSGLIVALFALVRMFCGNNYFADVLVGVALGASSFILCSQVCQRYLPLGRRAREFSLSASPLVVTLAGCYFFALLSPRFESKLGIGRSAAASVPTLVGATSIAASTAQGEGEGMEPEEGRAEELALAKRSTLFLPKVEAFLRGKLTSLVRPFPLLDVEVAPVKAGNTSYRCAAIRFEVPVGEPQTRRLVADRAARLVQAAFALDSQLQNVDILAVARDEGRNLDNSQMVFAGDEVPVFTASIQRKNLFVASPQWLNAPGVDGGSWLRARSRIYINERALPASPAPHPIQGGLPSSNTSPLATGTPQPSQIPAAPTPAVSKTTPLASPTVLPLISSPSSTPRPQATGKVHPQSAALTPLPTAPNETPTLTPATPNQSIVSLTPRSPITLNKGHLPTPRTISTPPIPATTPSSIRP